ncbi:MAG TPA: metallopeptidase TldD-related protein [Thermoguttaceae bacterium]|nr:metallopeptidase TldD-related protein [Thermoguttaceae bacterium]
MQERFYELADELIARLQGEEVLLLSFSGEESDFARFNRSAIRQAGAVAQQELSIELILGQRHVRSMCTLAGQGEIDGPRTAAALEEARERLPHVPEDPHLLYATEVRSGEAIGQRKLPDRGDVVDAVLVAGVGRDLVGLYAGGGIFAGFANSLGQRNWFSTYTFHLDWSFYHAGDKAVKSSFAGFEWDEEAFSRKVATAAEQLAILSRPPRTIQPGEYRVYLTPGALREFVQTIAWGGFGLKSHRTKSTSLLKMIEEGAALHAGVTLRENTAEGMAPNFTDKGFVKPDAVTLIERGQYKDCLVSPRSAKEYGAQANAGGEYPQSLDMAAGVVDASEILERLGDGIYVNQLWYLNYSDRPACRITGLTRFATFWVEGGEIAAPLNVMRFDETAYRVLGGNLLGLTAERELLPSGETYGCRSTDSARLPGVLVKDFRFTL